MFTRGDHLVTPLTGPTTHHGIYVSDEEVVHWSSGMAGGKKLWDASERKSESQIRLTSLDEFGGGKGVRRGKSEAHFSPDDIAERALSRVGEDGYCLFQNNCEHFARWCRTGEHRSVQVEVGAVTTGGGIGLGVPVVARAARTSVARRAAVFLLGRAAPAAGVVGAAAVGASAGVLAVTALFPVPPADPGPARDGGPDDSGGPDLSGPSDRDASLVGRAAGTAGAVVTGLGAVGTVAAAGVPGLGAVGITTGLTAIGGTVAGGLAVTFAAPVLVGLAAGYLGYRFWKG